MDIKVKNKYFYFFCVFYYIMFTWISLKSLEENDIEKGHITVNYYYFIMRMR